MLSSSTSSRMTGRLFLDIDHPAPCSGTVTTWHVCYYHPSNIWVSTEFTAIFQVWSPINRTGIYQRVLQTLLTANVINFGDTEIYICKDISFDFVIPINEGDVYGAYIPGVNGLRVVSDGFPVENRLLLVNSGPNISSVTTSETTQLLTGLELHLTADIGGYSIVSSILLF